MAEIIELIAADHLHIMRWQVRLAELRHRRGEPGDAPALAVTWNTLASLIDLHMAADEEVCGPPSTAPGRMAGIWPGKPGTRTGTSARSSARPATIRPGRRCGGPWSPRPWPPGPGTCTVRFTVRWPTAGAGPAPRCAPGWSASG